MGRSADRRPPSDTNSGSPGPGVWYTSRVPSRDQSNSATPSRYGLGSSPSVGTAQTLMSLLLALFCLRTQKVTRSHPARIPGFGSTDLPPLLSTMSQPVSPSNTPHCWPIRSRQGHRENEEEML